MPGDRIFHLCDHLLSSTPGSFAVGCLCIGLIAGTACRDQSKPAEKPSTDVSRSAVESKDTPPPEATETAAKGRTLREATEQQPPDAQAAPPASRVPEGAPEAGNGLDGLTFEAPPAWRIRKPDTDARLVGSYGKLQFEVYLQDTLVQDVAIAITHFPNMRGMDDQNITRWVGQFKQPDGSPIGEAVQRESIDLGEVKITLIDLRGTMAAGPPMMGPPEDKPGWRMVAAIINHPKGPHFFRMTGPEGAIADWVGSARDFLHSLRVKN